MADRQEGKRTRPGKTGDSLDPASRQAVDPFALRQSRPAAPGRARPYDLPGTSGALKRPAQMALDGTVVALSRRDGIPFGTGQGEELSTWPRANTAGSRCAPHTGFRRNAGEGETCSGFATTAAMPCKMARPNALGEAVALL